MRISILTCQNNTKIIRYIINSYSKKYSQICLLWTLLFPTKNKNRIMIQW